MSYVEEPSQVHRGWTWYGTQDRVALADTTGKIRGDVSRAGSPAAWYGPWVAAVQIDPVGSRQLGLYITEGHARTAVEEAVAP